MGVFVLLLFPNGRLPSRRWRWIARLAVVATVVGTLAIILVPGPVDDQVVPIDRNPLGIEGGKTVLIVLLASSVPMLPICILAAAAAMVGRFRRASGIERVQLKWLMTAGAIIGVVYAAAMVATFTGVGRSGGEDKPWLLALQTVAFQIFGLIPIAVGIAISRHGLYGIDALISRGLQVALLGLMITGTYVAIVIGFGALIGQQNASEWLSVAATAVIAIAFQPARLWLQRRVNRLVYGSRATPYEVLSDFAVRMTGRYTTGELLPRVAQTLSECLGGARVEIWLRADRRLSLEAAWPTRPEQDAPDEIGAATDADVLGAVPGDRVAPVRHRDELLGLVVVTKQAGESITPGEDEVISHVASQTGLVLRNFRLVEDLQASRQRLVSTADDQRRRLERDLHDGAQQNLVAVALMLRMAAAQEDRDVLAASVREAADQLQRAIAELRELARGIHPAILTDRGLGPALTSLAERCPVPVVVDNQVSRRLSGPVEGSIYFVVAESLTNVAKYAGARVVRVTLEDRSDTVRLEVADDGQGGADPAKGTGLLGLADRVAVVDGTFAVDSPPGRGTRVTCVIPVVVPVPARVVEEAASVRVAEPAL